MWITIRPLGTIDPSSPGRSAVHMPDWGSSTDLVDNDIAITLGRRAVVHNPQDLLPQLLLSKGLMGSLRTTRQHNTVNQEQQP